MQSDAELVDQVVSGAEGAFDELYRRHSQSAWRLAQSLTGNPHDAADAVSEAFANVLRAVRDGRLEAGGAFRSYLLTATRNAALDGMRRSGRTQAVDDEMLVALPTGSPGPTDTVTDDEDATLVAEAFRGLPERWRAVLWLTEVEGIATKEAATILGVSANGAAQLAVRARAGLRERYLQAHLRQESDPGCKFTVDRLGAYVGGGLSARDLAKVDQHLAGCEACQQRRDELEDVGTGLRRIVLPIPLVLAGATAGKVTATLTSASGTPTAAAAAGAGEVARTGSAAARRLASFSQPAPWLEKVAAVSAAAVLTAGVVSSTIVGNGSTTALPERELVDRAAAPAPATTSEGTAAGSSIAFDSARLGSRFGGLSTDDAGASEGTGGPGGEAVDDGGTEGTAPPPAGDDTGSSTPPPADTGDTTLPPSDSEPLAQASVGGSTGDLSGSVSAGTGDGSCTGGELNGSELGCTTDPPEDDGLTVSTDGELLPEQDVTLP